MTYSRIAATMASAGFTLGPSGPADAHVLAQGTLRDASGTPAAGTVQVYAWPEGELGKRTPLPRVATARADAHGRYRVETPDLDGLRRYRIGGDQRVDFLVLAATERATAKVSFSRGLIGGALTASAASARAPKPLDIRATRPASSAALAHASQGCTNYNIPREQKPGNGVVGEINNAYKDTKATFAYGRQADSEISVGMKENGDWELHGSVTVSNSRGAVQTRTRKGPYARKLLTEFQYQLSDTIVCAPWGPKVPTVRALRWNGGFTARKQRRTLFVCGGGVTYRGGDTFERVDSAATIWKAGATGFGVSLNIQSGFSSFVRTIFRFGGPPRREHRLCGNDGRPPTEAPRIFSGKPRG